MTRWNIQFKSEWDGHNGSAVKDYYVWRGTVPVYCAFIVSVSSGDGIPRCNKCSGPLVAMSASCRHARAVKRSLKAESRRWGMTRYRYLKADDLIQTGDERFDYELGWTVNHDDNMERFSKEYRRVGSAYAKRKRFRRPQEHR